MGAIVFSAFRTILCNFTFFLGSLIRSIVNSQTDNENEFQGTVSSKEDDSSSKDNTDEKNDDRDLVVEQLKAETKKAARRSIGLPMILEESEALQPLPLLNIDEKLKVKEGLAHIQLVYRNYSDKMRKLDFLNSLTTHSITLQKLNHPSQSKTARDGDLSSPATRSPLQGRVCWWPFKQQRRLRPDQASTDLHGDLEAVYVGQLCLSWDMLQWQYVRLEEFLRQDPYDPHCCFSQVAAEFQHFRVLVRRFIEDEPSQRCPRIDNYLQNRRLYHNFLQVPLVRRDHPSRGNNSSRSQDIVTTIPALRKIIWETIAIFWGFLRSDNYRQAVSVSKSQNHHQEARVFAQEQSIDAELLASIGSDLKRKQRRLNKVLRRRNGCVVRRFLGQGSHGTVLNDDASFMAQIELTLVSRVLNMTKLRSGHLTWCHDKLSRIKIQSRTREVHLDPSLPFFPCNTYSGSF